MVSCANNVGPHRENYFIVTVHLEKLFKPCFMFIILKCAIFIFILFNLI